MSFNFFKYFIATDSKHPELSSQEISDLKSADFPIGMINQIDQVRTNDYFQDQLKAQRDSMDPDLARSLTFDHATQADSLTAATFNAQLNDGRTNVITFNDGYVSSPNASNAYNQGKAVIEGVLHEPNDASNELNYAKNGLFGPELWKQEIKGEAESRYLTIQSLIHSQQYQNSLSDNDIDDLFYRDRDGNLHERTKEDAIARIYKRIITQRKYQDQADDRAGPLSHPKLIPQYNIPKSSPYNLQPVNGPKPNQNKLIKGAAQNDSIAEGDAVTDPLILNLHTSTAGATETVTTSLANGVVFDIGATGIPVKTAWVAPSDGLLVLDRNGNGSIDDGTELFGNLTPLVSGGLAKNGFAALAQYDENADGKIDSSDSVFGQLRILTGNGQLYTLTQEGISSLSLSNTNTGVADTNGNVQLQLGSYTRTDGSVGSMADYNLVQNQTLTAPTDLVPETPTVAAMPEIPATGAVLSLHQAMLRDGSGTLINLVTDFTNTTDSATQDSILDQILATWTGNQNVVPGSRGPLVDATKTAVVESFEGRRLYYSVVHLGATNITEAYSQIKEYTWAQLMSQTHLSSLFGATSVINDDSGTPVAIDASAAISILQARLASDPESGAKDLVSFNRALNDLGYSDLSGYDFFYNAFANTGSLQVAMESVGKTIVTAPPGSTVVDGSNILNAFFNDGQGTFTDNGGIGDDSYYFRPGDGQQTIVETGGLNKLIFGSGISSADTRFSTNGNSDLLIQFQNSTDEIIITGGLGDDKSKQVQSFQFANGTSLNLDDVVSLLSVNTTSDNTTLDRSGISYTETINALGAQDTVVAGSGDDTINLGGGGDSIHLGQGFDLINFKRGDGANTIYEPTSTTNPEQASDTIQFEQSLSLSDIAFIPNGNDLIVRIRGTN
ncbi:MAG: hypothetical protein K2X81_08780, partial [Candidatus Obscuribacterales bacterium]|nr:hypothetical protein [Candidatus Obscuribacterales bacterium]